MASLSNDPQLMDAIKVRSCRIEMQSPAIKGTGVLLQVPNSRSLYLLTAKHCLIGKRFKENPEQEQNFRVEHLTIYLPALEGNGFDTLELDQNTQVLFPKEDKNLDLAIVILGKNQTCSIPQIQCLKTTAHLPSEGIFHGYPNIDRSQSGVTVFVKFSAKNEVYAQRELDSYEHPNADKNNEGFSGGGIFSFIHNELTFIGVVYAFQKVIHRYKFCNLSEINQLLAEDDLQPFPTIETVLPDSVRDDLKRLDSHKATVLSSIRTDIAGFCLEKSESVAQICDLIKKPQSRVVAIVGEQGVGKSGLLKLAATHMSQEAVVLVTTAADWLTKSMRRGFSKTQKGVTLQRKYQNQRSERWKTPRTCTIR